LAGLSLSQQPDYDDIPEVVLDEFKTFVGNKKRRFGFGQP
jgi:hypothetical protein